MDEIQIYNRIADLKDLNQRDRNNIGLAVWGEGKKEGAENERRSVRRGRRNR